MPDETHDEPETATPSFKSQSNVRAGSFATETRCPHDVRYSPVATSEPPMNPADPVVDQAGPSTASSGAFAGFIGTGPLTRPVSVNRYKRDIADTYSITSSAVASTGVV